MSNIAVDSKHDLRKICQWYFSQAKSSWGISMWIKAGSVLISIICIPISLLSKPLPVFILIVMFISEYCSWRSDKHKNYAETIHRKLDFKDALGWAIATADITDILARTPDKLLADSAVSKNPEYYFASREKTGAKRALMNIQESAWWSKQLSEKMFIYSLTITAIFVLGSLIVILLSLSTIRNYDTLSAIGRVVTSLISLMLSIRLIPLTVAYYNFQNKAHQSELKAIQLSQQKKITETDAIKLYHEYHLDRALAPLIPDMLWRLNRDRLNELWENYRNT